MRGYQWNTPFDQTRYFPFYSHRLKRYRYLQHSYAWMDDGYHQFCFLCTILACWSVQSLSFLNSLFRGLFDLFLHQQEWKRLLCSSLHQKSGMFLEENVVVNFSVHGWNHLLFAQEWQWAAHSSVANKKGFSFLFAEFQTFPGYNYQCELEWRKSWLCEQLCRKVFQLSLCRGHNKWSSQLRFPIKRGCLFHRSELVFSDWLECSQF